jgi:hypothetical protein
VTSALSAAVAMENNMVRRGVPEPLTEIVGFALSINCRFSAVHRGLIE